MAEHGYQLVKIEPLHSSVWMDVMADEIPEVKK